MPITSISVRHRSYSQFRTFGMCPRKWWLSRRYDPKLKSSALAEGDLFHIALAKYYSHNDKKLGMEALTSVAEEYRAQTEEAGASDAVKEKLDTKINILYTMAELYYDNIAVRDHQRFEVLAVEKPFTFDLGDNLVIDGFIDMIVRDRQTGARYIGEHKYQTDFDEELLALDLQSTIYVTSQIPDFGILPVIYNVTQKPQYRQGKNETRLEFVARAKKKAVEEMAGWNLYQPNEYSSKWFERRVFSRGRTDMEACLAQMRGQDKMMQIVEANPMHASRNVGDQCLYFCPFKSICIDEDPLAIENFFVDKWAQQPTPQKPEPPVKGTRITI